MAEEKEINDKEEKEAVDKYIADRVKTNVADFMEEYNKQSARKSVDVEDETKRQHKQVEAFLDPIYGGKINQANFKADSAMDYANFYIGNDLALEYKDQVETIFRQTADAGRPMDRASILRYLVGREALDEPEKYQTRADERKKKQLQKAESAIDHVEAGRLRGETQFKDFSSLSVEEMEKVLEGVII